MTIGQEQPPVLGQPPVPPPPPPLHPARRRIRLGLDRYSGLYALVLVVAIFAIWIPDTFLTTVTLKTIASNQAITGILAVALVVPLAAGAVDLSVAEATGACSVLIAVLQATYGISTIPAIIITLAAAVLIGLVNGFVVVNLRINSFIATLATGSLLDASAIFMSHNEQVQGIASSLAKVGQGNLVGIPLPFVYLIVVSAIIWYALEYTPIGRYLYALGGNPEAARLAGLRNGAYTRLAFLVSGLLAGIAGIVLTGEIGVASAPVAPPYLLPAFAAVFLGSTQIVKGRANVLGTLVAVFLLGTGVKGLELVSAGPWVSNAFNGLALIVAVGLAVARGRGSIERLA
ncbi:MAG TPA: ABC transporter permease [Acidimicrobiales bacterium]|jgi:ribose transport system permease protein|nr:ABC transporter permease [Acidimicrobiales bacterium]